MSSDTQPIPITKAVNVNRLGFYLDGWADLAEGLGDKAKEVRKAVYDLLVERDMPDVNVDQVNGFTGISSGNRPYNITTTFPGATTIIYIGQHGKDLLASWYTYIRPVPNWKVLWTLTAIAAIFGLQAGSAALGAARDFSSGFFEGLISGTQALVISLATFVGVTIGVLVIEVLVLSVLGTMIIRDPVWVFAIQPNIFDADDIVAMNLSAHKSILHAIDKVGLDTALLRPKQSFKRRRNEEV